MIASALQWLAAGVIGGTSGAVMAALLFRLRSRRAGRIAVYEIDDSRIDSMAKAWAEGSGRPWAARSIADKLRLLSRLERTRGLRRRP